MNKYDSTLEIDATKGIPYYETAIPTPVPAETVPFYYTARINERLDNISNKFYSTPGNWWLIAKANNLANGTVAVSAGTKLFIPNV